MSFYDFLNYRFKWSFTEQTKKNSVYFGVLRNGSAGDSKPLYEWVRFLPPQPILILKLAEK